MIEIGSPGQAIELHDTKIETSSIITHFFDISTRDVDISTDAIEPDTWWLDDMDSVALIYLWTFLRALTVVPVLKGQSLEQEEIEKIADKFARLMGLEGTLYLLASLTCRSSQV
jgi:hypothetical protein